MLASLSFAPLLDPLVIALLALIGLIVVLPALVLRRRGGWLRLALMGALIALLVNPSLRFETREGVPTSVALLVDRSASQTIGNRAGVSEEAARQLEETLRTMPDIDLRTIEVGDSDANGTRAFEALSRGLEQVPPERLGAIIALSDGLVHDVPETLEELGYAAPLHVLLTGRADEFDARVVLEEAPRFALVDRPQPLAFKVELQGQAAPRAPVEVTIRRDGEIIARTRAIPGETIRLPLAVTHAGETLVEIAATPVEGELSEINNRVVARIDGIREALRVLLVSGEPHAGERVWRNLLKSDAAVDLVHFTILRPPEKQDGTPINELSLIAFPTRELFLDRIDEFDLIIFDRYQMRGVLLPSYYTNIANYVRAGGALLVASGREFATPASVANSAMGTVLPAYPRGPVREEAFRPQITDLGSRHPVTATLLQPGTEPEWSRWFRILDADITSRTAVPVMSDEDGAPLVLLDHVGRGRVALMLSDQVWLWARNFEGGGPYPQLLRRLAHWLMGEPELEEERLEAGIDHGTLTIERHSLADTVPDVTITAPDGTSRTVALETRGQGLFTASVPAPRLGLWTVSDGTHTALAHAGPTDPLEYRDVVSTADRLSPLTQQGGTLRRIGDTPQSPALPRLALIGASGPTGGADWIGIRRTQASKLTDSRTVPLGTGLALLVAVLALLSATWWREGR